MPSTKPSQVRKRSAPPGMPERPGPTERRGGLEPDLVGTFQVQDFARLVRACQLQA